jgi:hypothetical protein
MSEFLRDTQGRRLGEIVTQGTKRFIRDRYGHNLGWHDSSDNLTRNMEGRWIGRGDFLNALLMEALAKEG